MSLNVSLYAPWPLVKKSAGMVSTSNWNPGSKVAELKIWKSEPIPGLASRRGRQSGQKHLQVTSTGAQLLPSTQPQYSQNKKEIVTISPF